MIHGRLNNTVLPVTRVERVFEKSRYPASRLIAELDELIQLVRPAMRGCKVAPKVKSQVSTSESLYTNNVNDNTTYPYTKML